MADFWDEPQEQGWRSLAARLEEQTRYLSAIDTVSQAIGSALTTEELLGAALERTISVTGASMGGIYLYQADESWLLAAHHNLSLEAVEKRRLATEDDPSLRLTLEGKGPVTYSERLREPSRYISELAKRAGVQSWAGVTMSLMENVYGALILTSRDYDAFNHVHIELLKVIGQLLGVALSNTIAHAKAFVQVDSQLQHRVAELEAVLNSMSDGLIILSAEGSIVRANRAAERVLGLPIGELVGQSVLTEGWNRAPADCEEARGSAGPLARAVLQCEESINQLICMEIVGETRILSVSASPITKSSGQKDGTVVVIRDVTEERHAEQMKEEFLSLLSHELRAPLTVINGYAQMLGRRMARHNLAEEAGYAGLIKQHAHRMSGMVGDLVESGRLESGIQAIEPEPTDLGALVESVAGRVQAEQQHASSPHTITVSIEQGLPPIQADRRRMDQALTNLLLNAVKYSPEGGEVAVVVAMCEGDGQELAGRGLRVEVRDRGIGVPVEDRGRIFEHAYRGERGKGVSAQGLGLGLYICKLAVEAHGGKIGVEDGSGGVGSAFWFTLPVE